MDLPTQDSPPAPPAHGSRAEDIMRRIAEVLARPAAESGRSRGIDAGAIDLLECWIALRSESARARVLASARAALAAQAD